MAESISSSRRASSLTKVVLPSESAARTPSPIPCSTASWVRTSSVISVGCRPRVNSRQRRASSTDSTTPITRAGPPVSTAASRSRRKSWYTDAVDIPTLTCPTTRLESGANTGTFARTDCPNVPVCRTTSSRPASAEVGSVLTILPNSSGLGWLNRRPRSLVNTTNRTPVPNRTLVAMFCSDPCSNSFAEGTSPL